jgi:hypothetical protein
VTRIVRWFFSDRGLPTTSWRVVGWWELRRIPFNLVVGTYGLVCLLVFLWAIDTSGHLEPGEDAVEPIALLAAPFVINALYTLGWLVEVPARLANPNLSPHFGAALLKAGLRLGLALISVPAVVWLGVRVFQVLGISQ